METTTREEEENRGGMEGETTTMMQEEKQMMMPPVLEEKKKMKVLVAIDDSDGSFYALKWALDNLITTTADASSLPDQTPNLGILYILHVQQPFQPYIFPAEPAVYATSSLTESVKKGQEQNSAILLSRALEICKERLIKAETMVLYGDPKDMICQAVEKIHPQLLVVGSRGLGQIKRAFLGSVSDYCAHHAKCPILIVKPPPK